MAVLYDFEESSLTKLLPPSKKGGFASVEDAVEALLALGTRSKLYAHRITDGGVAAYVYASKNASAADPFGKRPLAVILEREQDICELCGGDASVEGSTHHDTEALAGVIHACPECAAKERGACHRCGSPDGFHVNGCLEIG